MRLNFLKFNILSLLIVVNACDSQQPAKPKVASDGLNANGYDPTVNMQIIDPRPAVSSLYMDSNKFRLNGFRLGMQDYMKSESPALTYFLPELADYVEILRCQSDTTIRIDDIDLKDIALGTSDPDEESKLFQQNNFWKAASESTGCLLISQGYGDKELFIDGYALSGSYHYLARACVNQDRLVDQDVSSRNCSRMIAFSTELKNYENARVENQREKLEQAMKARTDVDSIGRLMYYKVVEYNNALVKCEERENKRIASVQEKKAIGHAVGIGVSIAASLYAGGTSAAQGASNSVNPDTVNAVGTSAAQGASNWVNPDTVNNFNYMGAFKSAWADKDQIVGQGMAIGTMINDLFSSASDFPRSCTEAIKAKQDGAILAKRLKSAHELYATTMEAAQLSKDNKENLENQ